MLEIVSSLGSMVLAGLGLVLGKKGLDEVVHRGATHPIKLVIQFFKNKYWVTGGLFMLFGYLFRFMSINISDMSYVRIIFSAHIIIAIVGSRVLIKEGINKMLLVSVAIVIVGLALVSASPPLTRTAKADITRFFSFFIVLVVLFLIFLFLAVFVTKGKKLFFAVSSSCSYGIGAILQGVFAVNVLVLSSLLDPAFYMSLLFEPLLYLMAMFSVVGFILGQFMIHQRKISSMYAISYPLSEVIVLFGSFIIFNEDLSFATNGFRVAGILLLLLGLTVGLATQKTHIFMNPFLAGEKTVTG